ncbi:MAG: type II secretion system protein GspM [Pseudomonadota bacterium]
MSLLDKAKVKVEELEEKVDDLSLRERALIGVTALTVIAAVWYVQFLEPLEKTATQRRSELAALQDRARTANEQVEQQMLELAGGSAEQRARVARINQQIDELNVALGDYAAELIDPAEMAQLLEGVLRRQSGLQLVRIRNLPSETLAASEDENATRFYRHGLEIEVTGSYAATLDYLESIESLPWRLYWQVLELEVIEYPKNRIRIEVSTLSLDEEWIGA